MNKILGRLSLSALRFSQMNYIMVSKKVRVIGQVLYNLTTVQYEYIHIQYILYINHLSIQYIYIYTYLVSLITDGQSQYIYG